MRSLRYQAVGLAVFLAVVFTGCGYSTRSLISSRFRTIYVTPFVNKIDIARDMDAGSKYKVYRPMLETDITRSVNNKFLFDGNLKPVSSQTADVALKGELVEFRKEALRYTSENDVQEYRINLIVDISLWDQKENKLVWEEKNFTGQSTYFTSGSQAKSEETAVNDAISDLSRRIVERAVEEW
jgi:hypothetical protein